MINKQKIGCWICCPFQAPSNVNYLSGLWLGRKRRKTSFHEGQQMQLEAEFGNLNWSKDEVVFQTHNPFTIFEIKVLCYQSANVRLQFCMFREESFSFSCSLPNSERKSAIWPRISCSRSSFSTSKYPDPAPSHWKSKLTLETSVSFPLAMLTGDQLWPIRSSYAQAKHTHTHWWIAWKKIQPTRRNTLPCCKWENNVMGVMPCSGNSCAVLHLQMISNLFYAMIWESLICAAHLTNLFKHIGLLCSGNFQQFDSWVKTISFTCLDDIDVVLRFWIALRKTMFIFIFHESTPKGHNHSPPIADFSTSQCRRDTITLPATEIFQRFNARGPKSFSP